MEPREHSPAPHPETAHGLEFEEPFSEVAPQEFIEDPFGYFEKFGINIKPGEVKRDESGRVREDPTAVKTLPIWHDRNGHELSVVAKK